jgi:hypothetical protein
MNELKSLKINTDEKIVPPPRTRSMSIPLSGPGQDVIIRDEQVVLLPSRKLNLMADPTNHQKKQESCESFNLCYDSLQTKYPYEIWTMMDI